jgi:hypothetical protein
MAARKKQETAEEAEIKKPAAKKPKAAPAAQPESISVPADMLSQLMAQIQTLTQEVGELRTQVAQPVVESLVVEPEIPVFPSGELTQDEIDYAEAHPDLMPDDFFSAEIEADDSIQEEFKLDAVKFEEQNPGLLAEIAKLNADVNDVKPPVTQVEIDSAEAHPDLMPDDFFSAEIAEDEDIHEEFKLDAVAFEERNPGLLAEIAQLNAELDRDQSSVTQDEIDLAEAHPDLMPDDFFSAEIAEDEDIHEEFKLDAVAFEERNPGLLAEIAQLNAELDRDQSSVTEDEIDLAEAHPDLIPDDFFSAEIEDAPVEPSEIDSLAFEKRNPGLLGEIEEFNSQAVESHPLELSQEEIDFAEANPVALPEAFFEAELDDAPVDIPAIDREEFESSHPGLLAEIEAFNGSDESEDETAITAEEAGALLAGFDEVMAESTVEEGAVSAEPEVIVPVAEAAPASPADSVPDDGPVSADDIAAMFVAASDAAPVAEATPDDGPVSADDIAAMFASAGDAAPASIPDDGPVSADDIAAMFASAGDAAPVAETTPDDGPVSADDIAAMFASAGDVAPADSVPDDGPVSADDIAAMFAAAGDAAPVAEATPASIPDDGPVSADDIAAMFASASDAAPAASAETMSDDDIAQAIELGAIDNEVRDEVDADFGDELEDLTEEDLVAMIRQNIEEQGESLDEQTAEAEFKAAEVAAQAEAVEAQGTGVMSAVEIAALLATPDEEGDVVPLQSSAMSDDDLKALLSEVESGGGEAPIPTADELGELSFVQESAPVEPIKAKPVSTPKPPTGEAELGAIKAVPAHLAVRAMALPVRFEDGKLLCKVAEPIDRPALDQLSKTVGFGIIIEPTSIEEVVVGLRVAYAEFQDFNARLAVMSGAQNRMGLVEKVSNMWKKSA